MLGNRRGGWAVVLWGVVLWAGAWIGGFEPAPSPAGERLPAVRPALVLGQTTDRPPRLEIVARQTLTGLGACQGGALHDGFVYLYGDLYEQNRQSGPGIIRQYELIRNAQRVPGLRETGLEVRLLLKGQNLLNHPTGLTWNPTHGCYLGNTVTATKKGTIYRLDWPRLLIDRNLDHAILNIIDDDLAVQGCRPEFVRQDDRWLLATADYGQVDNQVRLYDPERLAEVQSTSAEGVLVSRFPCGPWVQQLHWVDARQRLVLAQNQIEGRRWRITAAYPWSKAGASDWRKNPAWDEPDDPTELEGFVMLDREYCLLLTSSRENNATIARWLE